MDPFSVSAVPESKARQTICGIVLAIKSVDTDYGTTEKMLVGDDRGFRVWGSVPSKAYWVDKGARVIFNASLSKSNKDESFGFFKRPTKVGVFQGPIRD